MGENDNEEVCSLLPSFTGAVFLAPLPRQLTPGLGFCKGPGAAAVGGSELLVGPRQGERDPRVKSSFKLITLGRPSWAGAGHTTEGSKARVAPPFVRVQEGRRPRRGGCIFFSTHPVRPSFTHPLCCQAVHPPPLSDRPSWAVTGETLW